MSDFKSDLPASVKSAIATVDPSKIRLPTFAFVAGALMTIVFMMIAAFLYNDFVAPFGAAVYIGAVLTAILAVLGFNGNDSVEIAKLLLKKGANPNARTAQMVITGENYFDGFLRAAKGQTPLMRAAMLRASDTGSPEISLVKALLAGGANLNNTLPDDTKNCSTPLIYAAAGRNTVGVEFLKSRGAIVDTDQCLR